MTYFSHEHLGHRWTRRTIRRQKRFNWEQPQAQQSALPHQTHSIAICEINFVSEQREYSIKKSQPR